MNLRLSFTLLALGALIGSTTVALAQGQKPEASITAINSQTGIVTGRLNGTGHLKRTLAACRAGRG